MPSRPTRPAAPARGAVSRPGPGAPTDRRVIDDAHARSAAGGLSRIERPDFSLVGRADLALALERNRRLHTHSAPVMAMLHEHVVHTQSMVVLADAAGTVIHSVGAPDFLDRAASVALKPGADWSEPAKGTNAIGTALVAEAPVLVHADEHYLHANHFLTCSAAPILDPRGQVLGVLDVSGDHRSYHPHTMAMVTMSVRMIENHWLLDEARHLLRLHFHPQPGCLGTLLEGIVAVAPDGRIAGANRAAAELLGLSVSALRRLDLGQLFEVRAEDLLAGRRGAAPVVPLHTRDGRRLAVRIAADAAPATPAPPRRVPALAADERPAAAAPSAMATDAAAALHPVRQPVSHPARPGADAWAGWTSRDPTVQALVRQLQAVADTALPVLLLGETGTGKEHLARALHAASARAAACFAVLSPGTPAVLPDLATLAPGGTLFLDAVDTWPPARRQALHDALDTLQRSGAGAPRLVTALRLAPGDTPGPALAAARLGDALGWRLAGVALTLPPLRERRDIAEQAQALLAALAGPGRTPPVLSPAAAEWLARQAWPGNLRQLAHVLQAAWALAGPHATVLGTEHLAPEAGAAATPARETALRDLELEAIRQAVQACGGNVSQAARRLGISRNTIYRRLGR